MSEMEKKYKCSGREMDSMYVHFQYVTIYWLEREGKSSFFSHPFSLLLGTIFLKLTIRGMAWVSKTVTQPEEESRTMKFF